MAVIDLSGLWQCEIPGQKKAVHLPGTLDENGVGHPDRVNRPWHPDMADPGRPDPLAGDVITSRFTRRFTYEGPAAFTRLLETRVPENERVFLDVERSRHLTLRLNGREIPALIPGTVSTPYTFELTGLLTGRDEITLICDNTYPGWPAADITCASAATDETQTNWNGVLGYLRLRTEPVTFIESVRAYPQGDALTVCVSLNAGTSWQGTVSVSSPALREHARKEIHMDAGRQDVVFDGLPLRENVRRWDEEDGNLYPLTAEIPGGGQLRRVSRNGPFPHDGGGMDEGAGNLPRVRGQLHAFPQPLSPGGRLCRRPDGDADAGRAFPLEPPERL